MERYAVAWGMLLYTMMMMMNVLRYSEFQGAFRCCTQHTLFLDENISVRKASHDSNNFPLNVATTTQTVIYGGEMKKWYRFWFDTLTGFAIFEWTAVSSRISR